jgi:glycosyltransferase involved in cell wall biosynthesis
LLVSVIIPTRNSGNTIEQCLRSLKIQTYKDVEIIVVDGQSSDKTVDMAKKYADNVSVLDIQKVPKGHFTATYQRNYGVKISAGDLVYYVDADMILTLNVVSECIERIRQGFDAVIVPEDSFGEGFWANCKKIERRCYWGDNVVEAPRFLKKVVWDSLKGLDEEIGGGGDDWDLHQKLLENGYKVGRTTSVVLHNEGKLSLSKLVRKRFMYGKDALKYLKKRRTTAVNSYFPVRLAFIRNWKSFACDPIHGVGVIFMRTVEYVSGLIGLLVNALEKL